MPAPAPTPPLSRLAGLSTILLTLLGWSSIPLFLKHFVHQIDAWTANGWRYGFSALVWAPALLIAWRRSAIPSGLWRAALVPSLFNILGQVAFGLAPYYHVDPGLQTFSLRLQIVFVTLGAALLFPTERRVIRSPLFLAGLVTVIGGTLGAIALNPRGLGGGTAIGVSLAIASGLFYGAYSLSVRHFMRGMNPLTAFAAISQYTAVGLIIPMFLLADRSGAAALDLPGKQMLLLLLSALIGIGIGHTLYFFSIARLGVAVSAGVVQLQPIVVSMISIRLFGEAMSAGQWIAGALAVLGAGVMLYAQHRAAVADAVIAAEAEAEDGVLGSVVLSPESEEDAVGATGPRT